MKVVERLRHDPKRELWFAWYATVVFYGFYALIFFVITRTQPPPKPWATPEMVVEWADGRSFGLVFGFAITFVIGGFSACSLALISYSMRRMSVSRVFAYSYLVLYLVAAIPGFLLICVAMTALVMRPERSAEVQQLLYDIGFLSFSGTMGVFLIGSLVWMAAILLDRNRVFPKWFGYLNLCNAMTEVVIAPSWIFHRGILAWDGVIAWWIDMVVFSFYTSVFILLLRNLILRDDFADGEVPALLASDRHRFHPLAKLVS